MRIVGLIALMIGAFPLPARADEASDKALLNRFYWGLGVINAPAAAQADAFEGVKSWPVKEGVLVIGVDPYGCAAKAGLTEMSFIDAINGQKIRGTDDFTTATKAIQSGDKLTMRAHIPTTRNGQIKWNARTLRGTAKSPIEALKGHVKSERDDVTGIKVYRHVDDPGLLNDKSELSMTVVHDGERYKPRLTIKYVADDWLFVRNAQLKIGDELIDIPLGDGDFQRDNTATIWEWKHLYPADDSKDDELLAVLELLTKQMEAKLVLTGNTYRRDRDLSPDEIGRLREMWLYYVGLRSRQIVPDGK